MDKKLLIFLLLIFVLTTTLVCIFRPKAHKHIMFENRNFKLELITQNVQNEKSNLSVKIPSVEMPSVEIPYVDVPNIEMPKVEIPKVPQINVNVPNIKAAELPKIKINNSSVQKQEKTNNTEKKQETKLDNTNGVQKSIAQPNSNYELQKPAEKVQTKNVVSEKPLNTEVYEKNQTKTVVTQPQTQIATPVDKVQEQTEKTQKVLTEQELEIIAWNKWRSDLQNKLMRDSKIAAPIGTTFYFSFTVDKYGNITNLKTWSNNSSYTQLAVKVIKPLLLSYQHTEILTFPKNSKRIITNADGSFTMANSSRYSSPEDYNDYERVIK